MNEEITTNAFTSGETVSAAWPDLFANLQAAYARVIDTQFELERRAAEAEDSRDLLRQVIVSMSEALFLLDRTGRIMQVNPAALDLIGRSESECLGQLFRKICSDPNAPTSAWKILNKSSQGIIKGLETELLGSDGPQPVNLSASVVRNRNGRIDGVLIITQDLQPQKHITRELAHHQRQSVTSTLAGKISKALINPIDLISGFTQHLQQVVNLESPVERQLLDDLHQIGAACEEITHLVTTLRAMNQPALGTFKPLDLNQLAAAALLLAAVPEDIEKSGIQERHFHPSLPPIQGNWHELVYAVVELLENFYVGLAGQQITSQISTRMDNKNICLVLSAQLSSIIDESALSIPPFTENVVAQHNGTIQIKLDGKVLAVTLALPGLVRE